MSTSRTSPPPAPVPADAEAPATTPPPQPKASATPPPADARDAAAPATLAAALLARLEPFLSESDLEVEARLCHLGDPLRRQREDVDGDEKGRDAAAAVPPGDKAAASDEPGAAPHLVECGKYRINVGVSAADFARMKGYMAVEKAAVLPFTQILTEDVNTQTGRFTYAIAPDGTESFVGCMEKKRLCNVEVRVPGCPYDIRVSVSTEVPKAATEAPAEKPRGFVRRKRRWTATEGTYEYAFTRVGADHDDQRATYEVELEGVLAQSGAGVTEAWLADLLDRILTLAQLPGNTGLPQRPAFRGPPHRRPH